MATLAVDEAAAPDLDDLLSEQAINDPDAFYRRLRDDAPVRWNGRWHGWIVTSYADVVGGLIETVSVALMDNFPKSTVDCDDVGLVLDALHVLRPDAPELDALDGILYIVKGRFDDAIRVLRQVIARAPAFAYARALLAFSLAAKGDPDWRQCASEVIEGGQSGDAEKLVRVLIARHDLMDARRARRLGGDFVMPESVMTLMESSQAATSSSSAIPPARDEARAPAEQLSGAVHYQGFLRA